MRLELTRVGLLVDLANHYTTKDALRDVVIKVLVSNIEISEFKLQSLYYDHFWTNTLEKSMNLLILPCTYGLISTIIVLLQSLVWLGFMPHQPFQVI